MSFETRSYLAILIGFALIVAAQKLGYVGSAIGHLTSGLLALYAYSSGLYVYFKQGRIFAGLSILVSSFLVFLYMYADAYKYYEFNTPEGVRIISFGEAIYFSIVTATTLGYGDFSPRGDVRYIAASQALIGYIFLGTYIGIFLDIGSQIRSRRSDASE